MKFAAYNHAEYIERRKPVMVWWSDYIENAGTGNICLAGNIKTVQGCLNKITGLNRI